MGNMHPTPHVHSEGAFIDLANMNWGNSYAHAFKVPTNRPSSSNAQKGCEDVVDLEVSRAPFQNAHKALNRRLHKEFEEQVWVI